MTIYRTASGWMSWRVFAVGVTHYLGLVHIHLQKEKPKGFRPLSGGAGNTV
jgi:hypothetical protein